MAQHEGDLRAVRRLAGAQDDGDRLARRGLVDVDRLEAAAVVAGVEQRELLRTVDSGPRCRPPGPASRAGGQAGSSTRRPSRELSRADRDKKNHSARPRRLGRITDNTTAPSLAAAETLVRRV